MSIQRVSEFDTWRAGYNSALVRIYEPGTTTLKAVYSDPLGTVGAANPQTLTAMTLNDVQYGKWSAPIYVEGGYYLEINSVDTTGVALAPIVSLIGEDASEAVAHVPASAVDRELQDRFNDVTHALDYGALSDITSSASTNNAILVAAIGAAAAKGGGEVVLPPGNIPFTLFSLPDNVVLRGQGRDVTNLQSQIQDKAITVAGEQAGMRYLTLDGINLQANSIGMYSLGNNHIVLENVRVKRFETGFQAKGMRSCDWFDVHIEECVTNVHLRGDTNSGSGGGGDEIRNNKWTHGGCNGASSIGLLLEYVDATVQNNMFDEVAFETNAIAVRIEGARFSHFMSCWWEGNTSKNFEVLDDPTVGLTLLNDVTGLFCRGGRMEGGQVTITGLAENIVFEKMDVSDVDFILTTVQNQVLLLDCIEDALVTISGDGFRLVRDYTANRGASFGTTGNNVATKGWSVTLDPGELVTGIAFVTGNQRNGVGKAGYVITFIAEKPGSTLAYDAQTVNFTLGQVVTGATSGATARIVADADGGATGTLTLRDIDGAFIDNELITDGAGGSATVNGALVVASCVIRDQDVVSTYEVDAAWAATFVATVAEVELQVTGETSKTVEWDIKVDMKRYG